jgi:hypothetical protein
MQKKNARAKAQCKKKQMKNENNARAKTQRKKKKTNAK